MVVLVEFVSLIAYDTSERQTDVALIRILFVDGMKPETFFHKVSSNSIESRSFG